MIVTVIGSPPSIIRLKTGGLENGMAMDLKVATNSIFQNGKWPYKQGNAAILIQVREYIGNLYCSVLIQEGEEKMIILE